MQLRDFVVVEFARAWQEERGAALVDPEVASAVRDGDEVPSDREGRLIAYSRVLLETRLGDGADGRRAVEGLRGALFAFAVLVPILGVLAGAATLRAVLPPNDVRPVNLLQFVGAGVVAPTAFFMFTTVLATLGARASTGMHWVVWAVSLLKGAALRTPAGRLAGRVLRRSRATAPLLAGYSHRFWLAALATFVGLGLWRFASEDYLFAWSSTLPDFHRWVEGIAGAVAVVVPGIDAPGPEQVAVSEYASLDGVWLDSSGDPERDEALRKGWWRLLLGGVAMVGILPRIFGLAISMVQVRRSLGRVLDTPGSRAILDAIRPPLAHVRVGDAAVLPRETPPVAPAESMVVDEAHLRGLAVVPFATGHPSADLLAAAGLNRLGLSDLVLDVPEDDDRVAMAAVTDRLGDVDQAPGGVVVVFDFAGTPDRVRREFLQGLGEALPEGRPVHVLLSGVDRFRRSPRGGRFDARRAAWVELLAAAGISERRLHVVTS